MNKFLTLIFSLISFSIFAQVTPAPQVKEGDGPYTQLIIRGVMLIDGTGAPPIGPTDIVVKNNRIVNIHPSLLPSFPGVEAQRQALEHGVKVAGVTVHLVTNDLDAGPIILQRVVPVLDTDTVETLSARILAEEHQAYVEAVRILLDEPWTVEGRRFVRRARVGEASGERLPAGN